MSSQPGVAERPRELRARGGQEIQNKSPDGLLTGDRTGAEGSAYLVSSIIVDPLRRRTTRSASNKGDVKVE